MYGWNYYDYYEWLIEKVNCRYSEQYTRLLNELYSIPFEWYIPKDENRAFDGMALRRDYIDQKSIYEHTDPEYIMDECECSVLEMMIAMAERFCYDVIGSAFMSTAEYFWFMIENLGLKEATNDTFNSEKVRAQISKMMRRDYDYDGNGGMFPLMRPTTDQRKVELWYQLSEWFNERYGI